MKKNLSVTIITLGIFALLLVASLFVNKGKSSPSTLQNQDTASPPIEENI